MIHIDYPAYDLAVASRQLADNREVFHAFLEQARAGKAHRLPKLGNEGRGYAGNLALLEPESPELPRASRIAGQAYTLLIAQVSAPPGTSVTLPLGEGPEVTYPAAPPHEFANADTWLNGFFLSALHRDAGALERLCAMPVELLRRAGLWTQECLYLEVSALQSFWLGRPDLADRLVEALAATDAERVRAEARPALAEELVKHALRIVFPRLQLLTRLVEGDEAGFNAALAQALELHKQHGWEQDQARQTQDARHFLALGPLAFAAFASSREVAVKVTSPYLPRKLYEYRP